MYIAVTGSKNNKDVYIYQSFRKKDGKSSSRIYKKLGKYNTLLEQFDGDNEKLMAWNGYAAKNVQSRTKGRKGTQQKIYCKFHVFYDLDFHGNDVWISSHCTGIYRGILRKTIYGMYCPDHGVNRHDPL